MATEAVGMRDGRKLPGVLPRKSPEARNQGGTPRSSGDC